MALSGDLGSGKTTFVQGLAKELGVKGKITSPTFVLMKQYTVIQNAEFRMQNVSLKLIHIDCYRMKSVEDALGIGITDYLGQPDSICVIEWPEKIKKILPKNTIWIKFKHINESSRRISISNEVASNKVTNCKKIIKTVIFDFDQVIGNSMNVGAESHLKLARDLKLRIPTINEVKKIYDEPWAKVIKTLWPNADVNLVKNRFNELIEYIYPLINGAKQTLQYLKNKKIKVLILTAGDQKYFKENLKRLAINRYIDFFFATGENKIHKPDKRVFRPILKYLKENNIDLNESLYVGDSPRKDWILAEKVGISFLGVTTGYFKKKDFTRLGLDKDRIIESIKKLPKWLEKNYDTDN